MSRPVIEYTDGTRSDGTRWRPADPITPLAALDRLTATARAAGERFDAHNRAMASAIDAQDERDAERWAEEVMARPRRVTASGAPPVGAIRMSAAAEAADSDLADLADLAKVLQGLPVVERNAVLSSSGWQDETPDPAHLRQDRKLVQRPDLADVVSALADLTEDEFKSMLQLVSDEWTAKMANFAKSDSSYCPMGRVS